MKAIKAVYDFIVGDIIILAGVIFAISLLALIKYVGVLAPLRGISGAFLILAILVVLVATLSREALGRR